MNIAIMTLPHQAYPSQYLAKYCLEQAILDSGATLSTVSEAALVLVLGQQVANLEALNHKVVYFVDPILAIRDASAQLTNAKENKQLYLVDLHSGEQHIAKEASQLSAPIHLVAVTACPTGVAHTFMAAEAIETEARKRQWHCQVETRGSVGVGNLLDKATIARADIVLIAADIEIDMQAFIGKKVYRTKTSSALKKTAETFDNALALAQVYQPEEAINTKTNTSASTDKQGVYQHLLTGVSYMLPMVVAGGLIIALSFALGGIHQEGEIAQALALIGNKSAFALMVPLLAGYIAYSIADRPGLAPGLIGGMLANSVDAGFLGGIAAGYLAGYSTFYLSKWIRLPESLTALKPILLLPFLSSLIVGLSMIYLLGAPIAYLMALLEQGLSTMQTANAIILGAILGGMMCIDMGGPINKVAYAFGVGLISAHYYTPMAAIMAAGMVPPLAMSLATLLAKYKFTIQERESGKVAFVLGLCFISEGAIPFAAKDPMRVLPACVIGGAITGGISMAIGAKLMAPHGGLFVLAIPGAVSPVLGYLVAILIGTLVAGGCYAILKRTTAQDETVASHSAS